MRLGGSRGAATWGGCLAGVAPRLDSGAPPCSPLSPKPPGGCAFPVVSFAAAVAAAGAALTGAVDFADAFAAVVADAADFAVRGGDPAADLGGLLLPPLGVAVDFLPAAPPAPAVAAGVATARPLGDLGGDFDGDWLDFLAGDPCLGYCGTARRIVRGRQAGRQTDRQTDGQTGKQAGRQADRQADRQAGRQTDIHTDIQAGRQAGRQIDRQAGE